MTAKMKNIMLLGAGIRRTIITGNRSFPSFGHFYTATVIVSGQGFIAQGITFRNTAGPSHDQAVALLSQADQSVFYRCGFDGYQDTLSSLSGRQFYKQCLYGTVDFIFGNARVVFQNCMIYARKPRDGQEVTITAQCRGSAEDKTGIVIPNSRVGAASDLKPFLRSFKVFLGRPWLRYSRTVFVHTYMESIVDPAGWLQWSGNFALDTLYYAEYNNSGPGSSTDHRVRWPGYHVITNSSEAAHFTV